MESDFNKIYEINQHACELTAIDNLEKVNCIHSVARWGFPHPSKNDPKYENLINCFPKNLDLSYKRDEDLRDSFEVKKKHVL